MLKTVISFIALAMFLAPLLGSSPCFAKDIAWKITGLGKPSEQIMTGPNGLLYIPSGNKTALVDANGKKLQEITVSGTSKGGLPVFGPYGTLYYPGSNSVQQILANGSSGWNFTIQEDSNKSTPLLSTGPQNLLYLPLPTALYAVDGSGHYKWHMFWDNTEANRPWIETKREIKNCTGNDKNLFVVYGEKNSGFSLLAVDGKGEIDWRYWLGEIKDVGLTTSPDGNLYVTANPDRLDKYNKGKVYMFEPDTNGSPAWTYTVSLEGLTSPTVTPGGQLYFCAREYLFMLDASDGKEIWRHKLLEAKSQPAVDENSKRIYLGTDDERLLAVSSQGRLLWDIDLEGNVVGPPLAAAGGEIYVATDKGILYKIKDQQADSREDD